MSPPSSTIWLRFSRLACSTKAMTVASRVRQPKTIISAAIISIANSSTANQASPFAAWKVMRQRPLNCISQSRGITPKSV